MNRTKALNRAKSIRKELAEAIANGKVAKTRKNPYKSADAPHQSLAFYQEWDRCNDPQT